MCQPRTAGTAAVARACRSMNEPPAVVPRAPTLGITLVEVASDTQSDEWFEDDLDAGACPYAPGGEPGSGDSVLGYYRVGRCGAIGSNRLVRRESRDRRWPEFTRCHQPERHTGSK